jgi:hypothetical protein
MRPLNKREYRLRSELASMGTPLAAGRHDRDDSYEYAHTQARAHIHTHARMRAH